LGAVITRERRKRQGLAGLKLLRRDGGRKRLCGAGGEVGTGFSDDRRPPLLSSAKALCA
jgi:hypothetical protein